MTWTRDAIERVLATLVQVLVALVPQQGLDLPEWTVVPIAGALAMLKAMAARSMPGTVSPASLARSPFVDDQDGTIR